MQYLSPIGNDQFIDANGDPLVGGRIETYLAGSSTQAATYTDDSGSTPQSNPIILDSLGKPTLGPIWLTGGVSYKFIIKNAAGSTLWTIDNIAGVNDATLSQSEWLESGFVPTYINGTSFSVPGDQTGTLQINRRLRTTNTSGFIYSTITNSVFSAGNTTVTLANDSGTLDAGLSAVAYGLLSAIDPSIPSIQTSQIGDGAVTSSKLNSQAVNGLTLATLDSVADFVSFADASDSGNLKKGLLPAASVTAPGVAELATNAEAQTGTDATRAVTPANLGQTVIGMGQTYVNQTGSRVENTTYTNFSGRTRFCIITVNAAATTSAALLIGGTQVGVTNVQPSLPQILFFLVPPGITYRVNTSSTILSWWELV